MHQFNPSTIFMLFYVVIAIFTMIHITIKHYWFEGLTIILGLIWPLYYLSLFLIKILEYHDDTKTHRKIKKQNFFTDTHEGRYHSATKQLGHINTKPKRRAKGTQRKNV